MRNNTTVYLAKNLPELLYLIKNIPNVAIIAGCTRIAHSQITRMIIMPETSIAVRHIPELQQITKTERYIELGASVTLSQIINLGEKKVPPVLYQAIKTIACEAVRNMATIGGNIVSDDIKMTSFASLLALDAKIEIATSKDMLLMPLSKYDGIMPNMCITKIRIPLEEWDIATFIRVGDPNSISIYSGSYVFLAKTQKDVLIDVRIVFAGSFVFKSRQIENMLIGNTLPLSQKQVIYIIERISEYITDISAEPIVKDQFLNALYDSLMSIASP